MDIAIVGRHTKVTESLRTRIEERMDKITELAPRADLGLRRSGGEEYRDRQQGPLHRVTGSVR